MTKSKSRKRSPFKFFLAIVFVALAGFFLLQQFGGSMLDKTETVEIENNPRNESLDFEKFKERKDKQREERQTRKSVAENRLLEFVQDYRKTGKKDLRASEVSFLRRVDAKAKKESPTSNFQDYAQYMSHALEFYKAAKQLKSKTNEAQDYVQKFLSKDQKELETFSKQNPSQEEWLDFIGK